MKWKVVALMSPLNGRIETSDGSKVAVVWLGDAEKIVAAHNTDVAEATEALRVQLFKRLDDATASLKETQEIVTMVLKHADRAGNLKVALNAVLDAIPPDAAAQPRQTDEVRRIVRTAIEADDESTPVTHPTESLIVRIENLRTALAFYANAGETRVRLDGGEIAREALAPPAPSAPGAMPPNARAIALLLTDALRKNDLELARAVTSDLAHLLAAATATADDLT